MSDQVFSLNVTEFETAWGRFGLAASAGGVVAVGLPGRAGAAFFEYLRRKFPGFLYLERPSPDLDQGRREIEEYLAGDRREFSVPFHLRVTPFQFRVLEAISAVPYGETATYGEIAARIGSPRGARAVGAACSANPIPLIIPCHRLVGAAGPGGYGGGLALKRKLLHHEGVSLE
ncbi:MAG: methylated-DNA--[protein]-cysteine S-methyltransferase [Candidatus Coatesbacteria bacterium]|nr:MAG: methylated-DNA--[protein]-cysteine S-methyltransferase [Candidatus Coatesbacteria bacterium]